MGGDGAVIKEVGRIAFPVTGIGKCPPFVQLATDFFGDGIMLWRRPGVNDSLSSV